MITPFFPALRARLAAQARQQSQCLRQIHFPLLVEQLRALLPAQLLASEDEGTNSRERIFSLRLTFECFVWQLLKPKTSCREVVRAVQALFKSLGLGPVDEGTSAFIQARQRLPAQRLEAALAATAQIADRRVGEEGTLNGRPVKVADCSTTQLPDTKKNQKRYPQPSAQKPGCGFPVLKFLVLFSLSSGAILRVVTGHWRNHDVRLLRGLLEALPKGDRPACTVAAKSITARPSNAWAVTMACSSGPSRERDQSSLPALNGERFQRKSWCASFVLTRSLEAASSA